MQVEFLINKILSEYKLDIPEKDYNSIINYLNYTEWGIAFELLCTVLEQEKIKIASTDYDALIKLGVYFEYDPILWRNIQIMGKN